MAKYSEEVLCRDSFIFVLKYEVVSYDAILCHKSQTLQRMILCRERRMCLGIPEFVLQEMILYRRRQIYVCEGDWCCQR